MEDTAFRDRVRRAVFWRTGAQFAQQGVQWAMTIVVIRLLRPSDYGLLAMSEIVTSFLALFAVQGLSTAAVQAAELSPRQFRQYFGLQLLLCAAMAAIQLAIAPLAAAFYRAPQVADMLRVLAVAYLFVPFFSVPGVVATRAMEFKRPALVQFAATTGSGLCVLLMAWRGYGVWALIGGVLTVSAIRAIGMSFAVRWWTWPEFRFDGLGRMIRFGSTTLVNSMIWIVSAQADVFIGGRVLGAAELGLYTEALYLSSIPVTKFVPALNEVGSSAYARIQHDRAAVSWSVRRAAGLVSTLTFPLFFGLSAVAPDFVPAVLGRQWLPSIPFIELLALAMPLYTMSVLLPPAVTALGHPRVVTVNSLIGLVVMPAAFLIGVQFGPIGMAWAWLTGFPLLFALTAPRALRVVGLGMAPFLGAAIPALTSSGAMAGAVWATARMLSAEPAIDRLLACVAAGAVVYPVALWVLFPEARRGLIALVRRRPQDAI